MSGSEDIKLLSQELLMNYPSISKPDAVRLAMNMLKGVKAVQSAIKLEVYTSIFFDYLLNGRN